MRLRDKVGITTDSSPKMARITSLLFGKKKAKLVVAEVNDKCLEEVNYVHSAGCRKK